MPSQRLTYVENGVQRFIYTSTTSLYDQAMVSPDQAVWVTTEYTNLASQGMMRKLGMTITGNPLAEPPWFQIGGVLVNNLVD